MNLKLQFSFILIFFSYLSLLSCSVSDDILLFDGKTLNGWEGDTTKMWKVVNGAIVGGSLTEDVPHNDFLCTTNLYDNFVLKVKFKLEGNGGFINAGVQFRSKRAAVPSHEMIGYQADIGDKYYGALYDESRRDVVLAGVDSITSSKMVKHGEWNDYEIRADKQRIQIFLNGQQTVDYKELDLKIPQHGQIGLQVHGGGKALVSFKDIVLRKID
jgi:Domain of Unknown Function (DUF1080)